MNESQLGNLEESSDNANTRLGSQHGAEPTLTFERIRERYLDDEQYQLLQAALMANPEAGSFIPGSGGLRKVRWAVDGKGKSGGLRVIYYWVTRDSHILS